MGNTITIPPIQKNNIIIKDKRSINQNIQLIPQLKMTKQYFWEESGSSRIFIKLCFQ